ncbi:MAG: nucleotide disphospho-sugar-binding domain-containing protein, partial [Mycobacterium sp.]
MAEILIASMQPVGHFGPLLNVAEGLVARGDRVSFLTASHHAAKIRAAGARPFALPKEAEFDESRLDLDLPGRTETTGIKRVNFDIEHLFLKQMPHQTSALAELMRQTRFDAIIVDSTFFGIVPFLLGDRTARPPVLSYSTTPLMLSSVDTAPFGLGMPPSSTASGRIRNRALNRLSHNVLMRDCQRAANLQLDRLNAPKLPMFILDTGVLADRYITASIPELDYPRSDLPPNVRYVGAVHPVPAPGFQPPPWWSELDGNRPVVHVTQGTIDNADLSRLLEPTIDALRDEDVVVVATTGGRDISEIHTRLPRNTYVAEYIPHNELLPKVDVMVTNGGFGAVQRALSTGVPLVVAGNTEDKPEVAARVAWSGVGINLRTGTPSAAQVRRAVRDILSEERYRRRARELESAYARRDGVAE